jgi:hypothetical protein
MLVSRRSTVDWHSFEDFQKEQKQREEVDNLEKEERKKSPHEK